MGKRKNDENGSESDEDEIGELVDVDFEFFDPAQIDYLAIKRLLHQLFSLDSSAFQVEQLTELILSQPLLGSTVKTDGIDSDPYALLSVININVHKDHPSIKAIVAYLLGKVSNDPIAGAILGRILSPQALASTSGHTGLIVSERLINMPPQIMPPMYKMLGDEIQWAIDENEPYRFENFIVISRCFRFGDEDENATGGSQPAKKQRRKGGTVRSYHAEDECIQKVASALVDYEYSNKIPREDDSFGVDLAGRVAVFAQTEFAGLLSLMQETFPPGKV